MLPRFETIAIVAATARARRTCRFERAIGVRPLPWRCRHRRRYDDCCRRGSYDARRHNCQTTTTIIVQLNIEQQLVGRTIDDIDNRLGPMFEAAWRHRHHDLATRPEIFGFVIVAQQAAAATTTSQTTMA